MGSRCNCEEVRATGEGVGPGWDKRAIGRRGLHQPSRLAGSVLAIFTWAKLLNQRSRPEFTEQLLNRSIAESSRQPKQYIKPWSMISSKGFSKTIGRRVPHVAG
jgi:hypothetical protein